MHSNASPFSIIDSCSDAMDAKSNASNGDGRLSIKVNNLRAHGDMAHILSSGIKHHFRNELVGKKDRAHTAQRLLAHSAQGQGAAVDTQSKNPTLQSIAKKQEPRPKLNILIMVIGSRGDIQPFIKVGKILKNQHGHRVRIASHPAFKNFIETDCGLEFFSVGGDPSELMSFMVKNPGLVPSVETLMRGEVGRRRAQMALMFEGFWKACIDSSDCHGQYDTNKIPFIADAIIANPPSFAHVHCAERLGCSLHIMFTFPYTPTQQFPHPLANIKSEEIDASYTNFMSYPLVEIMTWQGLGDLVNDFRIKTLGLEAVSTLWAPSRLYRMKVPHTYMWSPALVPKPPDWGSDISITGFVFLDLASDFHPPKDLTDFLNAGEPPIYIGFGSIVLDRPEEFTKMIFAAVKAAGVRAVLNKGWGDFGSDEDIPEGVHMLGNTPHDWLFPKCKAVIHHGGAGTTAIGLKCAKPTMIVPFFGDQQFWGSMVAAAKAGAHKCIPYKHLTTEMFTQGIKQCLTEDARHNAQKIADRIVKEGDGAENAVDAFHASLPLQGNHSMRCSVLQDRAAVWQLKHSTLRLSALAAELLVQQKLTSYSELRLRRQFDWNDLQGSGGPITGGVSAVLKSLARFGKDIGEGPFQGAKHLAHRVSRKRKGAPQTEHQQGCHTAVQARGLNAPNAELHTQRHDAGIDGRRPQARRIQPNHTGGAADATFFPPEVSTETLNEIKQEPKHTTRSIDRDVRYQRSQKQQRPNEPSDDNEESNLEESEPRSHKQADLTNKRHINGTNVVCHSNEHHNTTEPQMSLSHQFSADPDEPFVLELVEDAVIGLRAPLAGLVKFPMDVLIGIANGFHNLPRLYGDTTVRRPVRISGFYSGLRAAREEFVYGTWDAFSGVVSQPYRGAKEDGVVGFAAGMGKGLGGLVLKECAAILGPFGHTMKGVHRELTKQSTPINDIRSKRMEQGRLEVALLSGEQRHRAQKTTEDCWKIMAAIWVDGERVKRGLWNPKARQTKPQDKIGRAWLVRIPGGKWVAGAVGRVRYEREKLEMARHGAFESVEDTERAVQARKDGKTYGEAATRGKTADGSTLTEGRRST